MGIRRYEITPDEHEINVYTRRVQLRNGDYQNQVFRSCSKHILSGWGSFVWAQVVGKVKCNQLGHEIYASRLEELAKAKFAVADFVARGYTEIRLGGE